MEYSSYVVAIVALMSGLWLLFSFSVDEENNEQTKETRRTCRLCGDRMKFMCPECENGWCKYDFEEERDKEYLDYYFVNSISRHCKKCRAPELIVTASKLKKPVCFSCIEDCEENDCKKHDAFYQCVCRRTFCEYHAKLNEYENSWNPNWNGECIFCLSE